MGFTPTQEQVELLKATASAGDSGEQAREAFAAALTAPLRKSRDKASTVRGIFTVDNLQPGADARYPLDINDITGFVMPKEGAIPQNVVAGDEIWIPTFEIASSVYWKLQFARDGRFDVVARAKNRLANSIVKLEEENGWHVLLAGADASAREQHITSSGFTKELLSNAKVVMTRAGSVLTDMYISPEAMADVRSWDNAAVDEQTRRDIFVAGGLAKIYDVMLHVMEEFGNGREYNKYFCNNCPTNSLTEANVEIQIGLDTSTNDAFYMPVRQELTTYADPTAIKELKQGVIAYEDLGFAVVDTRRMCYTYFAV